MFSLKRTVTSRTQSRTEEEGMTGVATRTLQAERDLVPVITTRSVEIEAARRIPPDLLQDLIAAGCFRTLVDCSVSL